MIKLTNLVMTAKVMTTTTLGKWKRRRPKVLTKQLAALTPINTKVTPPAKRSDPRRAIFMFKISMLKQLHQRRGLTPRTTPQTTSQHVDLRQRLRR